MNGAQLLWHRKPQPPQTLNVRADGTFDATDGNTYLITRLPDTLEGLRLDGPMPCEPAAGMRALAYRTRAAYLAYVQTGFTEDEAFELLRDQIAMESDQ